MKQLVEDKSKIRKHYFQLRKSLSKADVEEKSKAVCDNFILNLLPRFSSNATFSLYFDAYNEVSTQRIADYFIKNNVSYSYPKILSKNSALKFVESSQKSKITHSTLYKDVKEIDGNDFIEPNILIIPLISFDSNKMRLGMGGGFFDRTIDNLKNKNKKLVVIALAYDFQLFEGTLPRENHDKVVDYVVSETGIIS